MPTPIELRLGDVVQLRKSHPCGGNTWRILRVGADVGCECLTCGRYVLVPRSRFEARIKSFLKRGPEPESSAEQLPTLPRHRPTGDAE